MGTDLRAETVLRINVASDAPRVGAFLRYSGFVAGLKAGGCGGAEAIFDKSLRHVTGAARGVGVMRLTRNEGKEPDDGDGRKPNYKPFCAHSNNPLSIMMVVTAATVGVYVVAAAAASGGHVAFARGEGDSECNSYECEAHSDGPFSYVDRGEGYQLQVCSMAGR